MNKKTKKAIKLDDKDKLQALNEFVDKSLRDMLFDAPQVPDTTSFVPPMDRGVWNG